MKSNNSFIEKENLTAVFKTLILMLIALSTMECERQIDVNGHWHFYDYQHKIDESIINEDYELSYNIIDGSTVQELYRYKYSGRVGSIDYENMVIHFPVGHGLQEYKISQLGSEQMIIIYENDTLQGKKIESVSDQHVLSDYFYFTNCDINVGNHGGKIKAGIYDDSYFIELVETFCTEDDAPTIYFDGKRISNFSYSEFSLIKSQYLVKIPKESWGKVKLKYYGYYDADKSSFRDTVYVRLKQIGFETAYLASMNSHNVLDFNYQEEVIPSSSLYLPIDKSYSDYHCNTSLVNSVTQENRKLSILEISSILSTFDLSCVEEFGNKSVKSNYKKLFETYVNEVFQILAKNDSLDIYTIINFMNTLELSESVKYRYRVKAKQGFLSHHSNMGADYFFEKGLK